MFSSRKMIEADELATLALSAATQIERLQHHSKANFRTVIDFADALARFSGLTGQNESDLIEPDPIATEMLGMSVSRVLSSPYNLDDLLNQIQKLVERFHDTSLPSQEDNLQQAKLFCLDIYRSISQKRPRSPYNEKGVFDYDYSFAGQGVGGSET
jgi:hypothetical protein